MPEEPTTVLENARKLRADVDAMRDAIGSYTTKQEARKKGLSMHVKFENEVDIMVALKAQNLMLGAPELISSLCAALEDALDTVERRGLLLRRFNALTMTHLMFTEHEAEWFELSREFAGEFGIDIEAEATNG